MDILLCLLVSFVTGGGVMYLLELPDRRIRRQHAQSVRAARVADRHTRP